MVLVAVGNDMEIIDDGINRNDASRIGEVFASWDPCVAALHEMVGSNKHSWRKFNHIAAVTLVNNKPGKVRACLVGNSEFR